MNQPLNERQWRFLHMADMAAGAANRFRWRDVGAALGYSEDESRQITDLLDRLVAIALPTDREAQFLPLGRTLARGPWQAPTPVRKPETRPAPARSASNRSSSPRATKPRSSASARSAPPGKHTPRKAAVKRAAKHAVKPAGKARHSRRAAGRAKRR